MVFGIFRAISEWYSHRQSLKTQSWKIGDKKTRGGSRFKTRAEYESWKESQKGYSVAKKINEDTYFNPSKQEDLFIPTSNSYWVARDKEAIDYFSQEAMLRRFESLSDPRVAVSALGRLEEIGYRFNDDTKRNVYERHPRVLKEQLKTQVERGAILQRQIGDRDIMLRMLEERLARERLARVDLQESYAALQRQFEELLETKALDDLGIGR